MSSSPNGHVRPCPQPLDIGRYARFVPKVDMSLLSARAGPHVPLAPNMDMSLPGARAEHVQ